MIYQLSEFQIRSLMEKAAETAVNKVLTELGLKKTIVSQREAYRKFGSANVTRWQHDGKVNPHKNGGVIYYKLSELEAMVNVNELYEKHFNHERDKKAKNG